MTQAVSAARVNSGPHARPAVALAAKRALVGDGVGIAVSVPLGAFEMRVH